MGFLCRKPTSNNSPKLREGKSPYLGETELLDEVALLLSGDARRCNKCKLAVRIKYLDQNDNCPDCRD